MLINLLTLPSAIALLLLLVKILNISGERSVIVTYPIYNSLVAAAFGYWIVRNNPAQSRIER